jgi:hypothetical protein
VDDQGAVTDVIDERTTQDHALAEADAAAAPAEVGEQLDRRAPWRAVRGYFATRVEMLDYAAGRLAARHSLEAAQAADACEICGGESNEAPVRLFWQYHTNHLGAGPWALLELAVGHIPIPVKTRYARFATHHAACGACQVAARRRYFWGSLLRPLALFLFAAGLMLTVPWAIGAAVVPARAPNRDEIERLGDIGLPALAVGLVMTRVVNWLRLPSALRSIGRRPFGLHRAEWWCSR